MFDTASLAVFVSATLALFLSPGPVVLYIVALSLNQGRMAGFVSLLGIGLASVVHISFAALGLSVLLMQSALAFSVVKYLGAAYLIILGIRTLTSRAQVSDVQSIQAMSRSQILRQGFVVNLLNPKTALFLLSFLPQFADPSRGPVVLQIIILGTIFVGMSIVSDSMYILVAGTVGQKLSGNLLLARVQKVLAGTTYIGLGLLAALSSNARID